MKSDSARASNGKWLRTEWHSKCEFRGYGQEMPHRATMISNRWALIVLSAGAMPCTHLGCPTQDHPSWLAIRKCRMQQSCYSSWRSSCGQVGDITSSDFISESFKAHFADCRRRKSRRTEKSHLLAGFMIKECHLSEVLRENLQ